MGNRQKNARTDTAKTKLNTKQPPVSRWKPSLKCATIGALVGLMPAVLVWVLDLPAKVNSFATEIPAARKNVSDLWLLDQAYTGKWTSENTNVDAASHDERLEALEGGPIYLEMQVYRGVVSGEIVSEGLKEHAAFSRVMIAGEERGGHIQGVVFDYVDGKPVPLSQFEMRRERGNHKGALHLKVTEQGMPFLPVEARLFRFDGEIPDGQFSPAFLGAVKRAAQATRSTDGRHNPE